MQPARTPSGQGPVPSASIRSPFLQNANYARTVSSNFAPRVPPVRRQVSSCSTARQTQNDGGAIPTPPNPSKYLNPVVLPFHPPANDAQQADHFHSWDRGGAGDTSTSGREARQPAQSRLPTHSLLRRGYRSWKAGGGRITGVTMGADIQSPVLCVMSATKERLGIMSREAALQMAVDENLNLVLEDELADPPVCRIVEAARYVYERNKLGTKKSQQSPGVKDLRVRLHIADNDYAIKLKAARRMLDKGSSVRFAVQRLIQDLSACSVVASPPVKGANSARFMLAPGLA